MDNAVKKPLLSYNTRKDDLDFSVKKWSEAAERFAAEFVVQKHGAWHGDKFMEPGNPNLFRVVSGQDYAYNRPSDRNQRQDNSNRGRQGGRQDSSNRGRQGGQRDRPNHSDGRQQGNRGRNF